MKVQLLGAEGLIAKFSALSEAVGTQYVDAAMQAGTEYMRDQIVNKAPVRSGRLKGSITVKNLETTKLKNTKVIAINTAQALYWGFVEFGHRIVGHRPNKTASGQRTKAANFIRKTFSNRKTTARQVIRDTFRDRMMGFLD